MGGLSYFVKKAEKNFFFTIYNVVKTYPGKSLTLEKRHRKSHVMLNVP